MNWGRDCPAGMPVPAADRCEGADCDSRPLIALLEGMRGRVTCLQQPDSAAGARLSALGVLPGVEIELLQRFPAYVLRIGYADIAVDEDLAATIRVRRD
jgi:DtxR family Mn-dependent transcriptional regulator